jgi:hypothetical protein
MQPARPKPSGTGIQILFDLLYALSLFTNVGQRESGQTFGTFSSIESKLSRRRSAAALWD